MIQFHRTLVFSLLLAAAAVTALGQGLYRNCATTRLIAYRMANAHSEAVITRQVVFDTTAGSFEGVVTDQATGRKISGAHIMFTQGTYTFLATSNRQGEFRLMRNEFTGRWTLKIQHPDFVCLEVIDIAMGGGISALLKLHRKE